jgi:tripartite-type tricarboxylate transporter receptor subunit TctC
MNLTTSQPRRDALKSLGAALSMGPAAASRAQGVQSKATRIVVPFPPGGTTDHVSRLIAHELNKLSEHTVIVENKPGAGTIIGVDAVAKAAPDGHTLVCVANSFCVNHSLIKKLPYDSLRDLRPVALMAMSEHVLTTFPGSGLKTLADVVHAARKNPGSLSFASFGQGTSAHLAGEMPKASLGVDLTHVPYKGQAPALADVLGGQVTMMFGNWPEFRGHVQSGKLHALGMATARRSPHAPTLATLTEQGIPLESNSWSGLLAPAATADAVVQKINLDVNRALGSTAVQEAFQKGGITALAGTPTRFADFIQSEIKRYAEVIQRAKITAET